MPTYRVGVGFATYREDPIDRVCRELGGTPVEAVELGRAHLPREAPVPARREVVGKLADAGIDVAGYGILTIDAPAEVRPALEFVADLGGDYASVEFDPDSDAIPAELARVGGDLGLDIGVHNHGPGRGFATTQDVLDAVEGHPERLGACVDTGHFLRAGQLPEEVIPRLGARVHAVHVADFMDRSTELVPGEGRLDLGGLVGLLGEHTDFEGPLVIEYERGFVDETAAVRATAAALADL
jgi:sugar phosphate isomerase/epimerase